MARIDPKALDRYRDAHWGVEAERVYELDDPDLPDHLIEMGKLRLLRVRSGNTWLCLDFGTTGPSLPGNTVKLSSAGPTNIVAFTHDKAERLYFVLNRATQKRASKLILSEMPFYPLGEVHAWVGGRQSRYPYPTETSEILVQCLGYLWDVVYHTEKQGDGMVEYHHKMGEEGGQKPILCLDEEGRLWLAGGAYSVPDPGITD